MAILIIQQRPAISYVISFPSEILNKEYSNYSFHTRSYVTYIPKAFISHNDVIMIECRKISSEPSRFMTTTNHTKNFDTLQTFGTF